MRKRTTAEKQQRRKIRRRVGLSILAGLIVIGGIYSYYGGFGTGACADQQEYVTYASNINQITVPEGTRIVALGEASHGNVEFQDLKLDVFKVMVDRYDVRAFALEGSYGGCEAVNRYIHGGSGTVEEAVGAIGFAIYRTEQMYQLVDWMRGYNEAVPEGEDICFYGFDMQRYDYEYIYLQEAMADLGLDTAPLTALWDAQTGAYSEQYTSEQRKEVFEQIGTQLQQLDPSKTAQALHMVDILIQNVDMGLIAEDAAQGNVARDAYMAQNTMWILKQEEARGNNCIFISGHNGHMEQVGSYGTDGKVMGNLLADDLGEAYYVIGTDFYHSWCNVPLMNGKRIVYPFYSYDPFAKASARCGYEMSWMDFSQLPEDTALYAQAHDYIWMGAVNEMFSPLYLALPVTYRVWRMPAECYDSMIYVKDAKATKILP